MIRKDGYVRGKFTSRVEVFITEMIGLNNATEAALAAGFGNGNRASAAVAGSRLMKSPGVKDAIELERIRILEEKGVTKENVLAEVARVAFSNVKHLFTADGQLVPVQDLPDFLTACISTVEHEEIESGRGEDRRVIGMTTKIKLVDKLGALKLLMQNLGMLEKKIEDKERPLAGASDEQLAVEFEHALKQLGYVKATDVPAGVIDVTPQAAT